MGVKKSILVCFIGTDGSGKSTLAKEAAKAYKKRFKAGVSSIYFGWKPFLPSTKIISYLFKRKNYRIAESMNRKHAGFSLLQEAMLFYYYLEYLARYIVKIAPNFYKKKIIVADRYFYDMFAHYSYASKSVLFKKLLRMFPSPDFTFFLDIDAKTAKKRKPEMDINLIKMHRSRYLALSKIMKLEVINTRKGIGKCLESVMRITESRIAKMLK